MASWINDQIREKDKVEMSASAVIPLGRFLTNCLMQADDLRYFKELKYSLNCLQAPLKTASLLQERSESFRHVDMEHCV